MSQLRKPERTAPKWRMWQRHWVGFLFLLPTFVLAVLYDNRMHRERGFRIEGTGGEPHFEPHWTPLTLWLEDALMVAFFGSALVYLAHAIYLRSIGRRWLGIKLLILPVYFMALLFLLYHAD